ncbi:MarR family winged helix-turn-helix transcriptional regulator [Roseobacter sp. HKCCA0434]|uniref:MarR family winged helix-turn-helix transcriptional regulator n=1 Tax=Roseobacter sp. HKCCA0434 TaxID=3079297 RepID=UPI002905EF81|nr:MarR family transcriptional regulator [Roseobacter sp. HKCCA0434]
MTFDLKSSLGYQLSLAARRAERGFEGALAGHELTRLGWCVLLAAGQEGLSRPSDIADWIGVDRAAISRLLTVLEDQGRITREADEEDARVRGVVLTRSGRDVLKAGIVAAEENVARVYGGLAAEDRAQLHRILGIINATGDAPDRI